MLTTRSVVCVFSVTMMVLGAGVVFGQTTSTGSGQAYPNKPVRIITSAAGGSADILARIIAQGISGPLGQPVIVENQTSLVSAETVAKAPPDGYAVLFGGGSFLFTQLFTKVSFDPVKDFSPITQVQSYPSVLVVHPSLPAKSVKELIALAKARPGELNSGTTTPGGGLYLAAALFKSMSGVNIVLVPYKGLGPALNALLGGEIQIMFADTAAVSPHVKSGRLRALAVTSLQPSVLAPGLPSVAGAGLPGYNFVGIDGIWAPAGTPDSIIKRLNQEIVRVLNGADVKAKLLVLGYEIVGNSPEEFAATIKSEITKIGNLIKDAGIKAD